MPTIIETERLILRTWHENDLDHMFKINQDPKVMEYFPALVSKDETLSFIDRIFKHQDAYGYFLYAVELKSTREMIGFIGLLHRTKADLDVPFNPSTEIGWRLASKHWGQGFAPEGAKAVLDYAFSVLDIPEIVSFTAASNQKSIRVMEKIGLHHNAIDDFHHPKLTDKSPLKPHVLYRLEQKEYLSKINVVPYNSNWPNLFESEAIRLQNALGDDLKEIYHIGSTSIPNMPAKPVIDIMLSIDNIDDIKLIAKKLIHLNYDPVNRQIIPHVSFFTKRQGESTSFHLHLHERGSPQIKRHVNFRDYVIQHPDIATEYAELKIKLAQEFSNDIYSYVSGKDDLVQKIDAKAKLWNKRKRNFISSNTGSISKDWSDEKLKKAMEANLNVHMTHFAQYLCQIELIRKPGFTIVNSELKDDTFNYVIDADFSSADADNKISDITNYFTQKNIPFSWWVSPHDQPTDLSAHLENNGYQNTENNCAMYFDLDAWDGQCSTIPSLEIIRAKDEKTLHDFARVLVNNTAAFKTYFSWISSILTNDDPIEYYVGYVNGKPVVRGLSCYFAQVAGLQWLSTVPDERNKGYGTAMQHHRLKRAKELGYHKVVLQASSEGYSLYRKLGYKECGHFREFKKNEDKLE